MQCLLFVFRFSQFFGYVMIIFAIAHNCFVSRQFIGVMTIFGKQKPGATKSGLPINRRWQTPNDFEHSGKNALISFWTILTPLIKSSSFLYYQCCSYLHLLNQQCWYSIWWQRIEYGMRIEFKRRFNTRFSFDFFLGLTCIDSRTGNIVCGSISSGKRLIKTFLCISSVREKKWNNIK